MIRVRVFQLVLAVAVTGLVAGSQSSLQAQEEEECRCIDLERIRVGGTPGDFQLVYSGRRGRLGVLVQSRANPATDSIGALVQGVTPDSPADEAGLRAGDIITSMDGKSLLEGAESFEEDESAPGLRLVARAKKLEPGDTVELEYKRDGETGNVTVVAREVEFGPAGIRMGDLGEAVVRTRKLIRRLGDMPSVYFRGPDSFALRLGALLPDLELVSLNEDLGEYFGATEGVLVVSAPEDGALGLKAGDVIRGIDGREVRDPSHAMGILRSYEPDEEVSFQILRKKEEMSVTGHLPEHAQPMDIHRHPRHEH